MREAKIHLKTIFIACATIILKSTTSAGAHEAASLTKKKTSQWRFEANKKAEKLPKEKKD